MMFRDFFKVVITLEEDVDLGKGSLLTMFDNQYRQTQKGNWHM